jgi:cobalamin biosynthesis Mg chelatase CobN
MTERLLEAIERGLWQASEGDEEGVAARFTCRIEGLLEAANERGNFFSPFFSVSFSMVTLYLYWLVYPP